MFAYLLIAAELVVLYTVFWYIFLREPRPYRIKSEMWGRYESDALARYFESFEESDGTCIDRNVAHEFDWLKTLDGASKNRLQTMALTKTPCPQAEGPSSHTGYAPHNADRYGWTAQEDNRYANSPFKGVMTLVEKLGNLSSRVP
ncbi:MAG: hypothetical protein IAF58_01165 [Leptolyngbya sp.]|nr:hypothetical protein [Candidatus Melainabacteria bacterium]